MILLLAALLIGIVAGLRAMVAPAVVSWAAYLGYLPLAGTPLAFLGWRFTPWIFSVLALGELITDQLPSTPSRKVPLQFVTRVIAGAFCGAAIGLTGAALWSGLVAGAIGAVLGTLGGAAARGALAARFGSDRPAALLEDLVAIGGAIGIVALLP
jgi:uncharacterized membrane protein